MTSEPRSRLTDADLTVVPAAPVTVALLSSHPAVADELAAAGHAVLLASSPAALAGLAMDADVVVLDVFGRDDHRRLLSRLGRTLRADVPLVLVGADEVDVALLGPSRTVHVVVPAMRVPYLARTVRQAAAAGLT